MTAKTATAAAVAIIGQSDHNEFSPLLNFLRQHPLVRLTGEYERISDALEAGLGTTGATDFAVILQCCSNEYSTEESSQLIGRMLFGRVLCCYGPWCLADGRSHDIWPVSTRVSAASAEMILARELAAFAVGQPPLSPMSAAEEVFAHRIPQINIRSDHRESPVFVISSERPLRQTVERIVIDAGLPVQQMPFTVKAVQKAIDNAVVGPRIAILDLDPLDAMAKTVLAALHKAFPDLEVLGLTVFPQASFPVGPLHAIIDKTDLLIQLQWQFERRSLKPCFQSTAF